MNIIELARSVGASPYTNRHFPDQPYHTFSPEKLQAFAAAVIKAHEAKLISSQAPVQQDVKLKDLLGKANALARIRSERITELESENDRLSAHMTELRDLHTKRIAELESTLRVALDDLNWLATTKTDAVTWRKSWKCFVKMPQSQRWRGRHD